MPELAEPLAGRSAAAYDDALARAGHSTDEVEDISLARHEGRVLGFRYSWPNPLPRNEMQMGKSVPVTPEIHSRPSRRR
jgi:hypothetical protein